MTRKFLFCLLMIFLLPLNAGRGIVIAVCDRYVDDLLNSLTFLQEEIHSTLPIEIWHAGDELSLFNQALLMRFTGVTIHDIVKKVEKPAKHFRGFQIKGYLGEVTSFDEFIIMDADLIFYQDPELLFSHPGYIKTGAFFFCDQESYKLYGYPRVRGRIYHGGLQEYYEARKKFITKRVASPSESFPAKWHLYWQKERPSVLTPFPSEHMESGCVAIDRTRHKEGLAKIRELNANFEETYRHVWGDKETFWIGMEMAKEPYHINKTIPAKVLDRAVSFLPLERAKIRLVQIIDDKIFYQQKVPMKISSNARILHRTFGSERISRKLDSEELRLINVAHSIQSN